MPSRDRREPTMPMQRRLWWAPGSRAQSANPQSLKRGSDAVVHAVSHKSISGTVIICGAPDEDVRIWSVHDPGEGWTEITCRRCLYALDRVDCSGQRTPPAP